MLTNPTFLYLATILPPILLGIIIWKSDKFPEPGKFLVTAFMLGVAIDLPNTFNIHIWKSNCTVTRSWSSSTKGLGKWWMEGRGSYFPCWWISIYEFFRAAFLEEGIKFALLIFICVRLEALNEPIDAIVYGAAIGLGYAAMENYGYLASPSFENAWTLEMVKDRYYPLVMHLGFGVVMGWLLSLNLFDETSRFKRRFMLIISLAIPVIYHGAYNYYSAVDIFPLLTVIL